MREYKLTGRGKGLVAGLIVLLLFIPAVILFPYLRGFVDSIFDPNSQPTVPPSISVDNPADEVNQPQSDESGSADGDDGNGANVQPDNENGTIQTDEDNGDSDNISQDIQSSNNNNNEDSAAENGEDSYEIDELSENDDMENGEQLTDNGEHASEQNEMPTLNPALAMLTIYISSNAGGTFDSATNSIIDEFLQLPQNNPEYVILVATPLLEIDELNELSATVTAALTNRGVPHYRIVFTTNVQNLQTPERTFEVRLSFLPIRPK